MNKEVRRSPNQQFEEKEQLQAKKLPDRTLKDSLNKELRLQPLQEQEETEPLQAKELPGHNPEVSLNKELRRQPEETPDGVIQAKTLESGFTPSPLSIQRGIGDKRKAVTGIKQKIGGIKQGVVGFLKDKGNRLKEKLGIKKPPEAGKEGAQRDPKEATNKAGNSFGGEINSDLGRGVDVPTGSRPDVDMPSAKQPEVKQPETAVKPPQTEVKTPETDVKSPETGVKPPETEVTPPETTVKPPEMEVKTPETEIKAPQTEVKAPETIADPQEKVKQAQQLEPELAQIAKITEQRATLKDPNAIDFFDQKFKSIVGDGNNPKKIGAFEGYLKGMAKKGGGDLEKGLLEDYRNANKPPEVIPPRGEMVSELPRLRQEAEKLKEEIAEWLTTNNDIKRGERLIKAIDNDLKKVMTDMEKKGLEVTKERVQGFENNLKGVRSEFEQAKTAPPDTEIGRYVKLGDDKVEIDQIRPDGTWVNVKNYKLFGLNNPKINDLIDQAEMNLRAAEANLVNGIPPRVVFDFTQGVTPEVAQRLRAINLNGRHIQVTGKEIPLDQSN